LDEQVEKYLRLHPHKDNTIENYPSVKISSEIDAPHPINTNIQVYGKILGQKFG